MEKWDWIKYSQLAYDEGQLQAALIKVIPNDFNTFFFFNTVAFVAVSSRPSIHAKSGFKIIKLIFNMEQEVDTMKENPGEDNNL